MIGGPTISYTVIPRGLEYYLDGLVPLEDYLFSGLDIRKYDTAHYISNVHPCFG